MNVDSLAAVGIHDEEAASSLSSPSLPVSSTARRFRCGAALASIILSFAAAAAALLWFGTSDGIISTATTGPPPNQQPVQQDLYAPDASAADITSPLLQPEASLDMGGANPLPTSPADIKAWSPYPVTSPEDHTLGYPFVAACIVNYATQPLANRMVSSST
jgi:hypothetical protein